MNKLTESQKRAMFKVLSGNDAYRVDRDSGRFIATRGDMHRFDKLTEEAMECNK